MIYVDKSRNMPLYRQLYVNITGEILSGAMPAGYRLPATRKLAAELSIGRNTVEKAYQQLQGRGLHHSQSRQWIHSGRDTAGFFHLMQSPAGRSHDCIGKSGSP